MLATMGAALALEVVEQLSQGPVHEEPQPDAGVTYAERLTKDDSPIFWWRSAHELHNQVRGLHPWPLASPRPLAVTACSLVKTTIADSPAPATALPGTRPRRERRSLRRGGGTRGHSHPRAPSGGPADDDRARLPRRPSRRRRRAHGMIALARRAAYDALRAVATRTRDLGEALADSRERLSDDRDRGADGRDRRRNAALAQPARLAAGSRRRTATSQASIRKCSTSFDSVSSSFST